MTLLLPFYLTAASFVSLPLGSSEVRLHSCFDFISFLCPSFPQVPDFSSEKKLLLFRFDQVLKRRRKIKQHNRQLRSRSNPSGDGS